MNNGFNSMEFYGRNESEWRRLVSGAAICAQRSYNVCGHGTSRRYFHKIVQDLRLCTCVTLPR